MYLVVALSKTAVEVSGTPQFLEKLVGLLTLARYTVNFAPMPAILFIGARMREWQIDPKHGNPQRWALMGFYACTASVFLQTLTVLIMPFYVQCGCKQGVSEGDVVSEMEHPMWASSSRLFGISRPWRPTAASVQWSTPSPSSRVLLTSH